MVDLDSDPTKLIDVVAIGKQLLITRGALTTFSIANDVAKYFAIIPAMFVAHLPRPRPAQRHGPVQPRLGDPVGGHLQRPDHRRAHPAVAARCEVPRRSPPTRCCAATCSSTAWAASSRRSSASSSSTSSSPSSPDSGDPHGHHSPARRGPQGPARPHRAARGALPGRRSSRSGRGAPAQAQRLPHPGRRRGRRLQPARPGRRRARSGSRPAPRCPTTPATPAAGPTSARAAEDLATAVAEREAALREANPDAPATIPRRRAHGIRQRARPAHLAGVRRVPGAAGGGGPRDDARAGAGDRSPRTPSTRRWASSARTGSTSPSSTSPSRPPSAAAGSQ